MPSSPAEFVDAAETMAGRLGGKAQADRLRGVVRKLAQEASDRDRAILGLQTAADPVELRRMEKRLAALRAIPEPAREVTCTLEALARFTAVSRKAAERLEVEKAVRTSVLASLRRLHGAVRRLAAANGDAVALADFEAACQVGVFEGATVIAPEDEAKAEDPR